LLADLSQQQRLGLGKKQRIQRRTSTPSPQQAIYFDTSIALRNLPGSAGVSPANWFDLIVRGQFFFGTNSTEDGQLGLAFENFLRKQARLQQATSAPQILETSSWRRQYDN